MNAHTLTPKQREVLHYLSLGLANKQIAAEMGLSPSTVKLHLNAIYVRLHVRNRVQAMMMVHHMDLL